MRVGIEVEKHLELMKERKGSGIGGSYAFVNSNKSRSKEKVESNNLRGSYAGRGSFLKRGSAKPASKFYQSIEFKGKTKYPRDNEKNLSSNASNGYQSHVSHKSWVNSVATSNATANTAFKDSLRKADNTTDKNVRTP